MTLLTNMIVMPNHLNNPVYVRGLRQPLEAVAAILDEQGKHNFALSLREAATIAEVYSAVLLEKTDTLWQPQPSPSP